MNYAILLSGGTGTRIGTQVPKQYLRVGDKDRMMVTYAMETLLGSMWVDEVVIVADPSWQEEILKEAKSAGLSLEKFRGFALPGRNRQESVFHGMEKILELQADGKTDGDAGTEKAVADTVLVHDAARPCLSDKLLTAIYEALPGHEGVMPALPMKDTVYLSADGKRISELIDRSCVYAGQAPELFLLKPYFQANRALLPEDKIMRINGASEPAVMAGMDIALIPGDEKNFKVTTKADLERLQQILEERK
ncbi:MAG: 2-C-methyl-D-erythritol 4-phosphate cytidylyltransferase [Lachnospiraceae bacterium]|nr:2-C-methyl-D-erythritol 4-phosphate cytidylyltransferase [Lachnospiraceae bacterium]